MNARPGPWISLANPCGGLRFIRNRETGSRNPGSSDLHGTEEERNRVFLPTRPSGISWKMAGSQEDKAEETSPS
ncbi:MAG: hypothetical protein ACR2OW_16875 [Methyloligellaceae bacterium]